MAAKKLLLSLRNAGYTLSMMAARRLPIDKRLVVFVSFGGQGYSDNPRAVSEALGALRPDAKITWLFLNPEEKAPLLPGYVRPLKIHSPAARRALATAACWVYNCPIHRYMVKRPGQFYVQTWHGDRGFKVCFHRSGRQGMPETKLCDLMLSGSDHGDMFIHTAFRYAGEILRAGSPRNDALLHPDPAEIARIRASIGVKDGEMLLLYAPTMRDGTAHTDQKRGLSFDHNRVLDLLEKKTGRPWRMLARSHGAEAGLAGCENDPRVSDLSGYEDMRDLLLASDLLITDYSSSAGDFPLTGRAVLLYQPDREQFAREDRSFYFDIDASPFPVARSQQALEALVEALDERETERLDRAILDFFGTTESGEAAPRVAERIARHMGKP